jgi:hypothetical protein
MRRVHLEVTSDWHATARRNTVLGADEPAEHYRAALEQALTERGVELSDDIAGADGTLVVRPWAHAGVVNRRGASIDRTAAGVDIRIERADGKWLFSGRFLGAPPTAAVAIADLVVRGSG